MSGVEAVDPTLTVLREPLLQLAGPEVLGGLRTALDWLQANQEQINDLNVFPVPDGDTGSNMYLTLRSAVEEAQAAPDPSSAASVLAAAAHGSLMGARGNSGVILSQVFRGMSVGLQGSSWLDATALVRAFDEARAVAYKAVMKPTEGTILTVVREAAAAAAAAEDTADIRVILDGVVRQCHEAVERTTDQLQVLRDAGVVDAGGFGFAVILEGFSRAVADVDSTRLAVDSPRRRAGEPRVHLPAAEGAADPTMAPRRGAASIEAREEGWGYCTEFLINGPGLDVDGLRGELAALGDSALVVGDSQLVRVHIHTAQPAPLIALAAQRGRLSKLKVDDMSAQHHEVVERAAQPTAPPRLATTTLASPRKAVGVVSVAPGSGFRDILTSLGADAVVEGGQTMNPSIEDLLKAVRSAHVESAVLLPNNPNVILTAQQVDALVEEVTVRVVPTRNLPQGISALLALEPDGDLDANCARMSAAITHVHALEITRAVRDSSANGHEIKEGDVLGLLDDEIVHVGGDEKAVIEAVIAGLAQPPELVTVFRGGDVDAGAASALVEHLRGRFAQTEFELHEGGQEHYPYVLSLE